MNSQIYVPYRARLNQKHSFGSGGTANFPQARWREFREREVFISEKYAPVHVPVPYRDVVQSGRPWTVFTQHAQWAESVAPGLRPPSGNTPIVQGSAGGVGDMPFDYVAPENFIKPAPPKKLDLVRNPARDGPNENDGTRPRDPQGNASKNPINPTGGDDGKKDPTFSGKIMGGKQSFEDGVPIPHINFDRDADPDNVQVVENDVVVPAAPPPQQQQRTVPGPLEIITGAVIKAALADLVSNGGQGVKALAVKTSDILSRHGGNIVRGAHRLGVIGGKLALDTTLDLVDGVAAQAQEGQDWLARNVFIPVGQLPDNLLRDAWAAYQQQYNDYHAAQQNQLGDPGGPSYLTFALTMAFRLFKYFASNPQAGIGGAAGLLIGAGAGAAAGGAGGAGAAAAVADVVDRAAEVLPVLGELLGGHDLRGNRPLPGHFAGMHYNGPRGLARRV